jgi:hypothetical protein
MFRSIYNQHSYYFEHLAINLNFLKHNISETESVVVIRCRERKVPA